MSARTAFMLFESLTREVLTSLNPHSLGSTRRCRPDQGEDSQQDEVSVSLHPQEWHHLEPFRHARWLTVVRLLWEALPLASLPDLLPASPRVPLLASEARRPVSDHLLLGE